MFDTTHDESAFLDLMRSAQRSERIAVAQRLLAAGRLCQLRMAEVDEIDRTQWCIDNWEAVAAEVGAELGISRGRASTQMHNGRELLERLPKLGAVFAAGEVDYGVISIAVFRTGLITDDEVMDAIDSRLAGAAPGWNATSRKRITELIDWWICALDPAAVRVGRQAQLDRHIDIGPGRDGLAELWGAVRSPDAAALDRRLDQLAATVCPDDPRTLRQRRADAVGALAAGQSALLCDCGSPDCTARDDAAQPGQVVIHLLAESATVSGHNATPGYLPGYGTVPAETIREMAQHARLRPLAQPSQLGSEPHYRPSTALADFIRFRDLTCRFPGCDKPAEFCDIDHTVSWDRGGLTHPSNLAALCRAHHLLKTFWVGEVGWSERQFADGTITWTSPSGRVYTTKPGGALLFPILGVPTEILTTPERRPRSDRGRALMMPTRRRIRDVDRAARICWERSVNERRAAANPPPF